MSSFSRPAILLVLALAACLLLAPAPPALSQTAPGLRFAPDRLALDRGATGVVEVQVQGALDLASFELDLVFDPAVVVVERVERVIGTDAQPTPSRVWLSLPTAPDPGYVQLGPGRVSFGGFSYGENNPPGASGDLTLARLTVRGVRTGQSSLTLPRVLLTDTRAQAVTATAGAGLVSVAGGGYLLYLPYYVRGGPVPTPRTGDAR